MNLMESPINWQGEIRPTSDPEGRLCQFDTMVDGIRAGAKNLLAYYNHHNCKTIRQIITRYAPSEENPTEAYIQFVSEWCGVSPDDEVDLNDPTFMRLLCGGIARFEQGSILDTSDIAQGVVEAIG